MMSPKTPNGYQAGSYIGTGMLSVSQTAKCESRVGWGVQYTLLLVPIQHQYGTCTSSHKHDADILAACANLVLIVQVRGVG